MLVGENLVGLICEKKKIQSVLVDCQLGIGETLRVKPLTWGHGPNFGSPGIWVVTYHFEMGLIQRMLTMVVTESEETKWIYFKKS